MVLVNILLVEDSPEMQLLISSALKPKYQVKCVATATEALSAIGECEYDLLLLDIELPDEDGFVLLSRIRMVPAYQETPVFFLSGRGKISDKVMGFSLGAEDYLVKPIDPVELQLRVESRIKRLNRQNQKDLILAKGPFVVDLDRQKLVVRDALSEKSIDLTPIEFKLFVLLLRKEDRILSRNQILDEIWPNIAVSDRTVDTHIYTLRKKLGSWGSCVEAVSRVGYRLVELKQKKAS